MHILAGALVASLLSGVPWSPMGQRASAGQESGSAIAAGKPEQTDGASTGAVEALPTLPMRRLGAEDRKRILELQAQPGPAAEQPPDDAD